MSEHADGEIRFREIQLLKLRVVRKQGPRFDDGGPNAHFDVTADVGRTALASRQEIGSAAAGCGEHLAGCVWTDAIGGVELEAEEASVEHRL